MVAALDDTSLLRAWCKTIVTTLFNITSYYSSAPSPRYIPKSNFLILLLSLIIKVANLFERPMLFKKRVLLKKKHYFAHNPQ